MCENCWQEMGAPKIDTPAVRAAALKIQELGEGSESLPFHIVLDDFNVRDEDLFFVARQIAAELVQTLLMFGDVAALRQVETWIALAELSEVERMSAIALAWEIWKLEA